MRATADNFGMKVLLDVYRFMFEEWNPAKERERVRLNTDSPIGVQAFAVWDGEQVLLQGHMGKSKPRSGRAVKVTSSTEARLLDHASSRPTVPRALGGALIGGTAGAVVGSAFHKADGAVAIVIEDEAENMFELLTVHRSSVGPAMRLVERVNRAARQLSTGA